MYILYPTPALPDIPPALIIKYVLTSKFIAPAEARFLTHFKFKFSDNPNLIERGISAKTIMFGEF